MRFLLKISLLLVLVTCFGFVGDAPKTSKPHKVKIRKFQASECDAVLKYLARIWAVKDKHCNENKRMVGVELLKLVHERGCLIGQPFGTVQQYLGKPDFVAKRTLGYDTRSEEKSQVAGKHINSIVFRINQDSTIKGISSIETSGSN
jgi:hypothetical protein